MTMLLLGFMLGFIGGLVMLIVLFGCDLIDRI